MREAIWVGCCVFVLHQGDTTARADAMTKGPFGVNVPTVGLDGSGIDIGQVEKNRPGDC